MTVTIEADTPDTLHLRCHKRRAIAAAPPCSQRSTRIGVCAALAALLSPLGASAQYAPAAPPGSGVLGYWSTDAGSVLRIAPCEQAVCIAVVTISPKAPGVIDANNPDPALRSRPVCQMQIGTGFQLKDADHGEGGRVYDPESGKTYKAVMSSDGNALHIRGYIGFKALGRSETWQRTTVKAATCVGTTHR